MSGRRAAKAIISSSLLAAAGFAASALAQDAVAPGAPSVSTPTAAPLKLHALTRAYTILPDGSYRETMHSEVQILNPALISQLAQFPLNYDDSVQTLQISSAYTLKPDGRKVPVAAGAIIDRTSPSSNVMLTSLKQKVIVFPDVAPGDLMVYDAVFDGKPGIPGQFTSDVLFPRSLVVDGESYSITAPKSLPLYFEAQQLTPQKSETGDAVTYSLSYSNAAAVPSDDNPLALFDYTPRLSFSTFKAYDTLVSAYAPMALPKMQVTAEVQKTADSIVAGTADKRQQAKKLYDWVNGHIRYVAISIGTGGLVPHDAASVLANGYGDCKDQAVLYVTLLKAEKIDANLVLIHSGNAYSVSQVPTIGSFDHMITWLPAFKLYADTTSAGLVPFGQLPLSEYGKSVAVVGDGGKALRQIPVPEAKDASFTYTLNAKLDDEGHDDSTSTLAATGRFLEPLRVLGRLVQQDTQGKLATTLLTARGNPRAMGGFTAPPDITAEPYQIGAAYKTPGALAFFVQNRPFVIPDGLRLTPLLSAVFFGPIFEDKYKTANALPCHSGRAVDDETLEFGKSRNIQRLPDDKKIATGHLTYSSHWSLEGNKVHVHRELEARFDQAVCTNPVKDEALSVAQSIKSDVATPIALVQAAAAH
jgi:Domain of Unknown Function with PDB structure (DUF3857)/Transglutaminase-like superfamily